MVKSLHNWRLILESVQNDYPEVPSCSNKYKIIAARLAELHDLPPKQIVELALALGLKLYPRPNNLPESWKLVLCKSYLAQKYINPEDDAEFVVVKSPNKLGELPWVIHRTLQGFADAGWFYEVIPQLESILRDSSIGSLFSKSFNQAVNRLFDSQVNGRGMTLGQIQAFNLFFNKHVSGIEGICTRCFKVSLPRAGAGERWTHRSNEEYEVRLSAAKPEGRAGQKIEYVSHAELAQDKTSIFATWNKEKRIKGFHDDMRQHDTHIPWDVYDYDKFKIGMPVCKCMKK